MNYWLDLFTETTWREFREACCKSFLRNSVIKVADKNSIYFVVARIDLENECPLTPHSSVKKHPGIEFISKKLPGWAQNGLVFRFPMQFSLAIVLLTLKSSYNVGIGITAGFVLFRSASWFPGEWDDQDGMVGTRWVVAAVFCGYPYP